MKIRQYDNNDWQDVIDAIGTFSEAHRRLAIEEIPKILAKNGAAFWVCEEDDKVVGILGYRKDDDVNAIGIYWAEWGYVHKDYRGKGIATKLWDVIEDNLRQLGCRKLYLDVGNEQDHCDAIRLYKKRGYVMEGLCPDFWDEGEDFLIFAKRLNDTNPSETKK